MTANSKLYIASKNVGLGLDHAYILYDLDGNLATAGDQRVIRGGLNWGQGAIYNGNLVIEVNVQIDQSADRYDVGETAATRGTIELDLNGRTADEVWGEMIAFASNLGADGELTNEFYNNGGVLRDTGIGYDLPVLMEYDGVINSNATVASVLAASGIRLETNLPANSTLPELPGQNVIFSGNEDDTFVIGNNVAYIDGADGVDKADFSNLGSGITVDLENEDLTTAVYSDGKIYSIENVIGTQYADTITGDANGNIIEAGAGVDTVSGGDGNDTFIGHGVNSFPDGDTYDGGNGIDTIDYSGIDLTGGQGLDINLTVGDALTDTLISIENVIGTLGYDTITGTTGNNVIDGRGGGDILYGQGGADAFIWSPSYSSDTQILDVNNDDIIQLVGITTDDLYVVYNDWWIDETGYAVSDHVPEFIIWSESLGINPWLTLDPQVLFTQSDDLVYETPGFSYDEIDPSLLVQFRNPNGSLVSIIDLIIGGMDVFETGTVFGNSGNDVIQGTSGQDFVYSADGNDSLWGGDNNDKLNAQDGDDTLDGGAGVDRLYGGAGNDILTYIYSENTYNEDYYYAQAGLDRLDLKFTSAELSVAIKQDVVSFKDFIDTNPDANVSSGSVYYFNEFLLQAGRFEELRLYVDNVETAVNVDAKNDSFNGTVNTIINGNLLSNNGNGVDTSFLGTVYANSGTFSTSQGGTILINTDGSFTYTPPNNFSGIDTFTYTANDGLALDDTAVASFNVQPSGITGTSGNDTLNGTTGDDNIYGLGGNDTLNGLAGHDLLDGGLGNDTMVGSTGNDIYIVDSASDVVTEGSSAGTDLVRASVTYTLSNNVENIELLGTANINATGNTLANILTGNAGNNTLNGGSGVDTMTGGLGDDTYVVNTSGEIINENVGEGNDTIQSSVAFTLAVNVENLTLTGTSNINGTGNALNNVLTGNSGNNTLNGSTGDDTMIGGAGNDTYVVDSTLDVVTESASQGTDLIQSSVTYSLSNNVENLTLTGSSAINATGNALDNVLTGNSGANTLTGGDGNDTLNGGSGNDTMIGGIGNDTYVVNATGDVVTENSGEGTDTVQSSIAYTLSTHLEHLTLTGTSNINGTGNASNNILTGNTGNNTLTGNAGNDTLYGGSGNDTLSGGNDNDTLYGGAGLDTMTGATGTDSFVFEAASAFSNIDVITDFNTGQSDKLNIADLLVGYTPGTSDINNFMSLTVSGGNTSVLIDRDGTGGTYSSQSIATLNGVTGLDVDDLLNNGNLIV